VIFRNYRGLHWFHGGGGPLYKNWLYILVLVNDLVLRRYKSRIAARLFVILGLLGTGLGLFMLSQLGLNPTAALMTLFFDSYLLITGWTFIGPCGYIASLTSHPSRLHDGLGVSEFIKLCLLSFRQAHQDEIANEVGLAEIDAEVSMKSSCVIRVNYACKRAYCICHLAGVGRT
jgi:hypothetical protein